MDLVCHKREKQQAEQDKGLLFPQAHGAKRFVFLPDEGLKVEGQLGTHDKKQRIYGKGRIEQAGREVVQEVRTPRYGGTCRLRVQAHRHGHVHAGREEGQLGNRHGQQGTDHQRCGLLAAGLDIEAFANADRQDGEDGRLACDRGDKRRHDIAGQHESPEQKVEGAPGQLDGPDCDTLGDARARHDLGNEQAAQDKPSG